MPEMPCRCMGGQCRLRRYLWVHGRCFASQKGHEGGDRIEEGVWGQYRSGEHAGDGGRMAWIMCMCLLPSLPPSYLM